jgi:hypothetical protein
MRLREGRAPTTSGPGSIRQQRRATYREACRSQISRHSRRNRPSRVVDSIAPLAGDPVRKAVLFGNSTRTTRGGAGVPT